MCSKKSGFSFIELLMVLVIVSILASLSFPEYRSMMERHRTRMVLDQLHGAIQLARDEAIRYGKNVTLCSLEEGQCQNNLSQRYSVFVDSAHFIRIYHSIKGQGNLVWKGFQNPTFLKFSPSGMTNAQNGTFYYCPKNGDPHFAKALFINRAGRVRLSEDKNHDGIDEGVHGQPLSCQNIT